MKASIKQISQMTGFSPATVSNALNRKRGVNRETSEKIFRTAEELGYQPEKVITKIKFVTYRKNGLIIDNNQFFPSMIEGVERQAKDLGYETIFSRLDYEDDSFEDRLKEVLEDTSSLMILLGAEMLEEDYLLFKGYKGHIVLLDGWSEDMGFDAVMINNTDSVCHAMEYLVEKGHKEIGYLRGNYRIKAFRYREYGYIRVLEKHGLPIREEYQVTIGTQLESAYEDMKRYLESSPKLATAYFADNDIIAIGAMRALQEKGVRIPEDVSIIGFDDIPFSVVPHPELTTIHVFKQDMGETAVRRALDYIRYPGRREKMKIQICTKYIERGSVKNLNID